MAAYKDSIAIMVFLVWSRMTLMIDGKPGRTNEQRCCD